MTWVAVKTLVIDPICHIESGVASTAVRLLSNPAATTTVSLPSVTARAAPGT
jgi:hypothetical protein